MTESNNINIEEIKKLFSDKKYLIDHFLGQGSYGKVFSYKNQYAVKVIELSGLKERTIKAQYREAKILKTLSDPHIINVYEYFTCNDKLCLVLDLCKGDSLGKFIENNKKLWYKNPIQFKLVIYQILAGTFYLHEKNLLHLDIKPKNIMLCHDYLNIKLIDLGLSQNKDTYGYRKGTEKYNDLERYCYDEDKEILYSAHNDMWMIATIIYIWVFNIDPFPYKYKIIKKLKSTDISSYPMILRKFYLSIKDINSEGFIQPDKTTEYYRQKKIKFIEEHFPDLIKFIMSIFKPIYERISLEDLLKSDYLKGIEKLYKKTITDSFSNSNSNSSK